MVTLHDPSEFACQRMNRDLWSDETVQSLIQENFVFLQLGRYSHEGQEHANYYPVDAYPYISVIDPLTGERVWKSHTASDTTDFFIEIMDFLSSHPLDHLQQSTANSRVKDSKMAIDLTEEEQLQLAMAASVDSHPKEIINLDSDDDEPSTPAEGK